MQDAFLNHDISYSGYRARFLEAAERSGAVLTSYMHPLKGLQEEDLYTDVAVLAEPDTRKWLVSVSGTHGIEGHFGSMCQTRYLDYVNKQQRDTKVGLLMVHLINPWGTSWKRRVNEDNIDLNRNYVDFGKPLPENPIYETIHDCFRAKAAQGQGSERAKMLWQNKVDEIGLTTLMNHLEAGQYQHQDGLYFGGQHETWSNKTLRAIIREHLANSSDVISFDLHTGAGAYGHPMLMAIAERDYPGLEDARRLYGAWLYSVLTSPDQTTDTGISAAATGYTSQAMIDMMQDTRFMQLVIECGTYKPHDLGSNPVADDHFLHLQGELQSSEFNRVKNNLTEFFFPDDGDWRELTWVRTRQIFERAYADLIARD